MNEELVKRIKEAGIRVYNTHSYVDGLYIANWWDLLHETGDIKKLICESNQSLPNFFNLFDPPTILTYTISRSDEIDIASWLNFASSSPDCLWFSSWSAEPVRGTRKHVKVMGAIYDALFELASVVIGLTKQKKLFKIHKRMGYMMSGSIPKFFDGETGYILYLTKDRYLQSDFKRITEKLQ